MMISGGYLKKDGHYARIYLQSLHAWPMVIAKLWLPILLAVICKTFSYFVTDWLHAHGYSHLTELIFPLFIILLQVYLWAIVLVGADHLLSGFSAFTVRSCVLRVNACVIRLYLAFAIFILWVLYMPHLFIMGFSWVLSYLGMKGEWLIIVSFCLASLLILSGIVSYIFTLPYILLRNNKLNKAFTCSAELVGNYWIYAVGVYIFCVMTSLLSQPNTMLLKMLFSHVVGILFDGMISFALYPLYVTLWLHALRFLTLRKKADDEEEGISPSESS